MNRQEYSVTRARTTWKPRVTEEDLPLFYCPECGAYYIGVAKNQSASFEGSGRSLIAQPPFLGIDIPQCCGSSMIKTPYLGLNDLPGGLTLDYTFVGGFNNNSLKISWELGANNNQISWVYLKTFTGTQLKYVYPQKRSPLIFAFADEDAFAYCDKSPCEECVFRCKSGFVAYVCISELGVVRMPLDRMTVIGSNSTALPQEK